MLDTLLESRATKERGLSGQMVSVAAHYAVIAAAIALTRGVGVADETTSVEQISYVAPPAVTPPVRTPPPPSVTVAPVARGFQLVVAPIDIPNVLPRIDLSQSVTNADDYTGRNGLAGGRADGDPGVKPRTDAVARTFYPAEVDRLARLIDGTGTPDYPDVLRNNGIEGEVRVSFVIDSAGRADPATLVVVHSSHALFTEAVRRALPRMRFLPAQSAGRNVRLLVEMPFVFSVK